MAKWNPGDSYCGTAQEAINYALDKLDSSYSEQIQFLQDWREGNLRDWADDFEFEPHPSHYLPK